MRYRLVADVDGPIANAFLQLNPANQGCEVLEHSLSGGKYAFGILGDSSSGPIADIEGVIAGDIGSPPSLVVKQESDPSLHTHWIAGSDWLLALHGDIKARAWDAETWQTVYDPSQDPEHMPKSNVRALGPNIFWEVGVAGYNGVMVWSPASGSQPLIRWYGDYTQGAGNFNTDGISMVWTQGSGKQPDGTLEYPIRSIMTAPFTTDAGELKTTAKRLRSDPGQLVPYPFGVGCGYAARQVFTPSTTSASVGSNDLLVVRLSDGVSWIVSAPPVEQGMGFGFVLGLTCDEVFATANFADEPNTILRIRLDSLGPGIAPD